MLRDCIFTLLQILSFKHMWPHWCRFTGRCTILYMDDHICFHLVICIKKKLNVLACLLKIQQPTTRYRKYNQEVTCR
jgi:hypothetical protein